MIPVMENSVVSHLIGVSRDIEGENDLHRRTIGEVNYEAACSLPMEKIAQLYLDEFQKLFRAKMNLNFV